MYTYSYVCEKKTLIKNSTPLNNVNEMINDKPIKI